MPERVLARAITERPSEPGDEPDLDKALSEALLALDRRLIALESATATMQRRGHALASDQFDFRLEDASLIIEHNDGSRWSIDLSSLPRRAVQRSLTFTRDPETHQISGATQIEETT